MGLILNINTKMFSIHCEYILCISYNKSDLIRDQFHIVETITIKTAIVVTIITETTKCALY